jgi:hypothetical protein
MQISDIPLFILRAGNVRDTWFRGIDVDGVVCFFPIKPDLEVGVVARKGSHFGAVERQDMVDDGFNRLLGEIGIVDS